MAEIMGGVFTGLGAITVKRKLVLLVARPSLTVKVTDALPDCPDAGLSITVRLLPAPPKIILPTGSSVGLEELPETSRFAAAVWPSPTVKGMAGVLVSCPVV